LDENSLVFHETINNKRIKEKKIHMRERREKVWRRKRRIFLPPF
jgi:hypothetical protein